MIGTNLVFFLSKFREIIFLKLSFLVQSSLFKFKSKQLTYSTHNIFILLHKVVILTTDSE